MGQPSFNDRFDPSIRIVPYDPAWPALFDHEAAAIRLALGSDADIQHYGSTSIPGLAAKPVIDILILLPSLRNWLFKPKLEALGYFYQSPGPPDMEDDFPFFGKPRQRPRQFHVHVAASDSPVAAANLATRDYLRTHPEEAAAYGALKASIAGAHPGDRIAYIAGKDPYVRDLQTRALAWQQAQDVVGSDGLTLRAFGPSDVDAVMQLCAAEGWPSHSSSAELTVKSLIGPGKVTLLALRDGRIVGFAFGYGDGFVQGYLSEIAVDKAYRGQGIGRALVQEMFRRLHVERLDLLSLDGSVGFYERLPHSRMPGFRLYPRFLQSDDQR